MGTKLLNPMASYVGTYRQLWDKLGDPASTSEAGRRCTAG